MTHFLLFILANTLYVHDPHPHTHFALVDAPISVRSRTANADSCDATEFSPDKREFIEQLTTTPYPNGPADWLAFRASLHSNRSVEKIKGSLWNWYAIRINYASKDNRWWNCRLTIRIKTWRVQRVKESFAGRVIPNFRKILHRSSHDRSSLGRIWCGIVKDITNTMKSGMKGD